MHYGGELICVPERNIRNYFNLLSFYTAIFTCAFAIIVVVIKKRSINDYIMTESCILIFPLFSPKFLIILFEVAFGHPLLDYNCIGVLTSGLSGSQNSVWSSTGICYWHSCLGHPCPGNLGELWLLDNHV